MNPGCADEGCTDCLGDGELCGDPGECCGDLCVLWPDDQYHCGLPPSDPSEPDAGPSDPVCIGEGDTCTTQADCCQGLTCIPNGADLVCAFVVP